MNILRELMYSQPAAIRRSRRARSGARRSFARDRMSLFAAGVMLAGTSVMAGLLVVQADIFRERMGIDFWVLFACLMIGDRLILVRGNCFSEASLASVFAFALLLTAGTALAVVAMAVVSALNDALRGKRWIIVAYNAAQYTISFAVAGAVLFVLVAPPQGLVSGLDGHDIPAIAAAGAAFSVVNLLLVSTMAALDAGKPILSELRTDAWAGTADDATRLAYGSLIGLAGVSLASLPLLVLGFIGYLGSKERVAEKLVAMHDPLTGLPNRALLEDRVQQAIASARRDQTALGLLLLDLDRFKQINDTLGHDAGDALLRQVSARLQSCLRADDTVARLGGDEFVVVLPRQHAASASARVADQVRTTLEQPYELGATSETIGASVGIAHYPGDGNDLDALLASADQAMYQDKRRRAQQPRT